MCDVRWVRVMGHVVGLGIATAITLAAAPLFADSGALEARSAEAAAGASAERSAEQIEAARRAVLDDAFQAELPPYQTGSGSAGQRPGRPGRSAGGQLDDAARERPMIDARDHGEGAGVSWLMTVVMWGLVGVLGVLGAAWLVAELARDPGDAALAPDEAAHARMQAASDAIIDRPLGDADELAGRGLHAEAIHTLLLRTLQELARSAAVRVGPATTSREILAKVPLLADARSALAGLITAVEITYFGDEPANAADYERCRQQFHVFAAAFRGAGPRPAAVAA
jgi:hypothetical protein